MSLFGFDYRQYEGSYVEDPTDMWTGNVGEVRHAQGHRGGTDTVHIREQAQVEGDIIEDGAEDSGSLEDGSGQISAPGGTDLHEAGSLT